MVFFYKYYNVVGSYPKEEWTSKLNINSFNTFEHVRNKYNYLIDDLEIIDMKIESTLKEME